MRGIGISMLKERINNIKPIKVFSVILAVSFLLGVLTTIGESELRKGSVPKITPLGISEVIDTIPANSGEILIASTPTKRMYIDSSTLNIKIEDIKTGAEWNTIFDDDKATENEKSPLIIKFLGKDSQIYEWSAFKYCISDGNYKIYKIKNGVRIEFNFMQSTSHNLNEYMPQKISIERFEEAFLDKIDQKVAEGTLSEEKAERYKSALNLVYEKDQQNNCYYNKFAGSPSASVVNLLIELAQEVGYTTEMLIQDSQEFGITVDITEYPEFKIVMEVLLENDDMVVRIPTYEIKARNDFYVLQNVIVLPNFGLVSANEFEEGYILVPDGSGALFKINTFDEKYPEYSRPVYHNTYYNTVYDMPEYGEELHMPVFGMMFRNQKSQMQGFMGIIENGAHTAYINVKLGTKIAETGGLPYNKVFASFDTVQYSRVKVFGPYSSNDARYLVTTDNIDMDFCIRYKLFPQDASYFNMAKEYRDYLVKRYDINVSYDNKPKLFFEVIGALTIEDRFLGVPYDRVISMTTYNELMNILKDMESIENKVIIYNGIFNSGINNYLMSTVNLVKENGKLSELQRLMDFISHSGDEFFAGVELTKVYQKGNGFKARKHAIYGFNGKPQEIMGYNLATGRFNRLSNRYFIVNPLYFINLIEGFIKSTEAFGNICLHDIGNVYYANYNPREMIDPLKANAIIQEGLTKLSEIKTLALNNPNTDRMVYGKYALNVSRESGDFGTMYCSIPFRQLVMNGIVEYTTLDVNMSKEDIRYYILQAIELGSHPKFTISSKTVDLLKNTSFSHYFSAQYSKLKDTIFDVYREYKNVWNKIKSKEIVDHQILQENVFMTKYASGVSVIVNYNRYPVTVDGNVIEPLGYRIWP